MTPSCYLIILAQRLPQQTREAFIHELTAVHAPETAALASSIGVIQGYVQLVAPTPADIEAFVEQLSVAGCNDFPIPIQLHKSELASCVMLRYIDEATVRAVFKLDAYRESVAKHVFAEPRFITMGEMMASYDSSGRSGTPSLSLSDGDQGNFSVVVFLVGRKEQAGADLLHAKLLERAETIVKGAICKAPSGTTYTLLKIPHASGSPYDDTPFSAADSDIDGYMERYSFRSMEDATTFFQQSSGEALSISPDILQTLDKTFWYAGVENVVVDYSKQTAGLWLKSQIVSTALAVKTFMGR
jgi:hypothetical protein